MRRLSYANVTSTIAVVLAMTGGAYAAITVTGKAVKDGTLSGKDIRDRSLKAADFREGQLKAGATGAQGPEGPAGPAGERGPSDAYFERGPLSTPLQTGGGRTMAALPLPAGDFVVTATGNFDAAGTSDVRRGAICIITLAGAGVANSGSVELGAHASGADTESFSMTGAESIDEPAEAKLNCSANVGDITLFNPTLTAIQVGENNGPAGG